jgi:hypothetical protein
VIEKFFEFLKEIGIVGLFIVMIIEGISVPIFPRPYLHKMDISNDQLGGSTVYEYTPFRNT